MGRGDRSIVPVWPSLYEVSAADINFSKPSIRPFATAIDRSPPTITLFTTNVRHPNQWGDVSFHDKLKAGGVRCEEKSGNDSNGCDVW
ncbi:hypothetical protein EU245_13350 [Lentibacillus lipolyticus]|nr:hypothetical protein EU245_13350 [Lentibacillus lipolyticus]